uniref:Protein kinase domain-containing protein n=1 Tax=Ranid herpesvirus 4 TaxID=2849006 RepID=A0A8F3CIJ9_9VIRU|nr:MAG: hypothetical protein [Ranid herpesvirus 4]
MYLDEISWLRRYAERRTSPALPYSNDSLLINLLSFKKELNKLVTQNYKSEASNHVATPANNNISAETLLKKIKYCPTSIGKLALVYALANPERALQLSDYYINNKSVVHKGNELIDALIKKNRSFNFRLEETPVSSINTTGNVEDNYADTQEYFEGFSQQDMLLNEFSQMEYNSQAIDEFLIKPTDREGYITAEDVETELYRLEQKGPPTERVYQQKGLHCKMFENVNEPSIACIRLRNPVDDILSFDDTGEDTSNTFALQQAIAISSGLDPVTNDERYDDLLDDLDNSSQDVVIISDGEDNIDNISSPYREPQEPEMSFYEDSEHYEPRENTPQAAQDPNDWTDWDDSNEAIVISDSEDLLSNNSIEDVRSISYPMERSPDEPLELDEADDITSYYSSSPVRRIRNDRRPPPIPNYSSGDDNDEELFRRAPIRPLKRLRSQNVSTSKTPRLEDGSHLVELVPLPEPALEINTIEKINIPEALERPLAGQKGQIESILAQVQEQNVKLVEPRLSQNENRMLFETTDKDSVSKRTPIDSRESLKDKVNTQTNVTNRLLGYNYMDDSVRAEEAIEESLDTRLSLSVRRVLDSPGEGTSKTRTNSKTLSSKSVNLSDLSQTLPDNEEDQIAYQRERFVSDSVPVLMDSSQMSVYNMDNNELMPQNYDRLEESYGERGFANKYKAVFIPTQQTCVGIISKNGTSGFCYGLVKGINVEMYVSRNSKEANEKAEMLITLKHPCLIAPMTFYACEQKTMIMTYISSGTKLTDLTRNTLLYLKKHIRTAFANLATGLAFLHEQNILHNLICPESCLLMLKDDNPYVILGDYRDLNRENTFLENTHLSDNYKSLDRLRTYKLTKKADVWALALTIGWIANEGKDILASSIQNSQTKLPIIPATETTCDRLLQQIIKDKAPVPTARDIAETLSYKTHMPPDWEIPQLPHMVNFALIQQSMSLKQEPTNFKSLNVFVATGMDEVSQLGPNSTEDIYSKTNIVKVVKTVVEQSFEDVPSIPHVGKPLLLNESMPLPTSAITNELAITLNTKRSIESVVPCYITTLSHSNIFMIGEGDYRMQRLLVKPLATSQNTVNWEQTCKQTAAYALMRVGMHTHLRPVYAVQVGTMMDSNKPCSLTLTCDPGLPISQLDTKHMPLSEHKKLVGELLLGLYHIEKRADEKSLISLLAGINLENMYYKEGVGVVLDTLHPSKDLQWRNNNKTFLLQFAICLAQGLPLSEVSQMPMVITDTDLNEKISIILSNEHWASLTQGRMSLRQYVDKYHLAGDVISNIKYPVFLNKRYVRTASYFRNDTGTGVTGFIPEATVHYKF